MSQQAPGSTSSPTRRREEQTSELESTKRQKTESTLSANDCAMLELIKQREEYRAEKNWAKADEMREALRAMGVECYDKEREWRASDGRRGAIIQGTNKNVINKPCTLSEDEINVLISKREQARAGHDWAEADKLRTEMRESGIEVNDQMKMWRTNTGMHGNFMGSQANRPQEVSTKDEVDRQIEALIQQREEARKNKDWKTADTIRDQLKEMKVSIYDKEKLWKTEDGRLGIINSWSGNGSLSTDEIMKLLLRRQRARASKDWATSDKLRDELRVRGCDIYDKDNRWKLSDGRSGTLTGLLDGTPGHQTQQEMMESMGMGMGMLGAGMGMGMMGMGMGMGAGAGMLQMPGMGMGMGAGMGMNSGLSAGMGSGSGSGSGAGMGMGMGMGMGNFNSRPSSGATTDASSWGWQGQGQGQDKAASHGGYGVVGDGAIGGGGVGGGTAIAMISDMEIQLVLSRREQARAARDWTTADKIRDELRRNGVIVSDKENSWKTVDGRRFGLIKI